MMVAIYEILRTIVHKLWIVVSLTIFFSIFTLWMFGSLLSVGVFSLGLSSIFYNAQDLLLYYPNDPPDSREFVLQPSNYKLPYESIKIKNKDGLMIHLFFVKQASNSRQVPTLLFLHGNAGNMGQRLLNVTGLYHRLNLNIFMVEYRGYGLSEGSPSEKGLYVDAQAALDYLFHRSDIDTSKILLFGRSLGGAVAIDLASSPEYKNKIWALVVENTFTSIPDMAKIILRWQCLKWMPYFIHKNKYMSINKIGNVSASSLVICGSNDTLVPPAMGKALYVKCNANHKKLVIISGGGHNDTWTCREYYPALQTFLLDVPSLPSEVIPYFDDKKECNPSAEENIVIQVV